MAAEKIDSAALRRALVGTRFSADLQHFASVGSTNSLLLEHAAEGSTEGTVYIAEEQTAGRGRGGHGWHSAPGEGLYVSALVKPALRLQQALCLSLATGLAAQSAIRETTGLAADIRWPNDLLLGKRKCGGILVETAVEPGDNPMLRYAVIGIGLNVNHASFPAELSDLATSLRLAVGGDLQDRQRLLLTLLRGLDRELTALEGGADDLLERFANALPGCAANAYTSPNRVAILGRLPDSTAADFSSSPQTRVYSGLCFPVAFASSKPAIQLKGRGRQAQCYWHSI